MKRLSHWTWPWPTCACSTSIHKGSCEDPSRYRCIDLLNQTYKILPHILLGRLVGISDSFLQDWQPGSRAVWGCRDNTMILHVLCDKMMDIDKSLTIILFLWTTLRLSTRSLINSSILLWKRPVRPLTKVRVICRSIYKSASAFTSVKGTDNKQVRCESFKSIDVLLITS